MGPLPGGRAGSTSCSLIVPRHRATGLHTGSLRSLMSCFFYRVPSPNSPSLVLVSSHAPDEAALERGWLRCHWRCGWPSAVLLPARCFSWLGPGVSCPDRWSPGRVRRPSSAPPQSPPTPIRTPPGITAVRLRGSLSDYTGPWQEQITSPLLSIPKGPNECCEQSASTQRSPLCLDLRDRETSELKLAQHPVSHKAPAGQGIAWGAPRTDAGDVCLETGLPG